MDKYQLSTVKENFKTLIKSHKHDMTVPASSKEFERVFKDLNKQYTKHNNQDLINALDDVSDMMEREKYNHQNESDADLILIKRPNGHLHIADYDEAIKCFVDGYINL